MSSSFLKKSKQFTSVLDDLSEEKEIERLEKVVLEEADEVRKLQLQYCEAKRTLEKFQTKLENIENQIYYIPCPISKSGRIKAPNKYCENLLTSNISGTTK